VWSRLKIYFHKFFSHPQKIRWRKTPNIRGLPSIESATSNQLNILTNECQYSACDFLFNFNRNYASILYHFRVIASYLSKVAYLTCHTTVGGDPDRISSRPLVPENCSLCSIVWSCLHDPIFSRFDTILVYDGHTDTR